MKRKKIPILYLLVTFLALLITFATRYMRKTFGSVAIDSILFTIFAPLDGVDYELVYKFIYMAVLPALLAVILEVIFFSFVDYQKKGLKAILWILNCLLLVFGVSYFSYRYDLVSYLFYTSQDTNIYRNNEIYVNPLDVSIEGEDTNNLILIYLESYENSFADKDNGGASDINCLSELSELAKENDSFSHNDKIGGPLSLTGTTWTIGSMVSHQCGIPLKSSAYNNMGSVLEFMPGAYSLGDVLHDKGYLQEFFIGQDADFAGTRTFFEGHGYDYVYDMSYLEENYEIKDEMRNKWGIYDCYMLEYAKEELNSLYQTSLNANAKFSFTMATIDCHTPAGYICDKCPEDYDDRYMKAYACQSRQISEFIEWCSKQEWFFETTIVIVGDHNSMADSQLSFIPKNYVRTTYNCFINSRKKTDNKNHRIFTRVDYYPTILSAMGFDIKGNHLGLGVDLYSSEKTICEKHGFDYLNREVQKRDKEFEEAIYGFSFR